MQNVQNAAEIQQKVINLVELYRTKVGIESKAAKKLADYYKEQYDAEIDFAYSLHEKGIDGYCLNIDIPEDAIDDIRANEQLLGYFYKIVAGENADEKVLTKFLADKYVPNILTKEDEEFLMCHFAEMVNYIIQTPNNNLSAIEGDDRNDIDLLPTEVLRLIKELISIPSSSKIYNPFTGFAQLPCLFKDCSFYCEESYMSYFKKWNAYCDKVCEVEHIVENKVDECKLYAWMRVALYANNIDATLLVDGSIPQTYDVILSYIPYIPSDIPNNGHSRTGYEPTDTDMINKLLLAYKNLADGGKMVLILPTQFLWKKKVMVSGGENSYLLGLGSLWGQLKADNSLLEIIQLPPVMGKSLYDEDGYCIIIAEKGCDDKNVTFIDARFAFAKSDNRLFYQTLDLEALHKMIRDGGKDPNTGLRKFVQIPRTVIDSNLLTPQVYVIEKPLESEKPVPLIELCSLVTSRIYDVQENLPEDTPWIGSEKLSDSFRGVLDIATLDTADCPNNPIGWSYGNIKLSNILMGKNRYSESDIRISHYRNCKYIDGKSDAVLFKLSKDGISIAVIEATGKGIAISADIHVMLPNDKIDALSLAALLRIPVVYRQIGTYEKYGLYGPSGHLKDVLVPTSKRIIIDEKHRILLEQKALKEKDEKLAIQKTEYINEVRMRKHDMGQYIFELVNIEDLMRYYLENRDKEKNFCQELESLLDNFRTSLGELSTLLADLSKEEQFGEPELFNIDEFLSKMSNRHKADGFKIEYDRDESSIKGYYQKVHADELSILDDFIPEEDSDSIDDFIPEEDSDSIDDFIPEENTDSIDDFIPEENTYSIDDFIPEENTDSIDDFIPEENTDSIDDFIPEENTDNSDLTEEETVAFSSRIDTLPPLYVSPSDINRLVSNIIDNARKHGFTDHNRKDYEVKINVSIDTEKNMFLIDFSNNGTPLPEGMDKMRYGIKGEKAGKTGGTGIGGSYVKKFVEHYGGDYDVFMDNGWTVIRIYLPIR